MVVGTYGNPVSVTSAAFERGRDEFSGRLKGVEEEDGEFRRKICVGFGEAGTVRVEWTRSRHVG